MMMTEEKDRRVRLGESGWPGGLLLAMDTSTSMMSVALIEDGRVLSSISTAAERNHSVHLLPAIQDVLQRWNVHPRELKGIVVGAGPGSYTGVRIGITAAKTMAWALGLPVTAVSSLEAMAAGAMTHITAVDSSTGVQGGGRQPQICWIVPLLNARRGQAFTALWALERSEGSAGSNGSAGSGANAGSDGNSGNQWSVADDGWQRLQEDGIRLVESWLAELQEMIRLKEQQYRPDTILLTGEVAGFEDVLQRFAAEAAQLSSARFPIETIILPWTIEAEHLGLAGTRQLSRGQSVEPHSLLPNYTQLTEAEANLAKKLRKG